MGYLQRTHGGWMGTSADYMIVKEISATNRQWTKSTIFLDLNGYMFGSISGTERVRADHGDYWWGRWRHRWWRSQIQSMASRKPLMLLDAQRKTLRVLPQLFVVYVCKIAPPGRRGRALSRRKLCFHDAKGILFRNKSIVNNSFRVR
jgi:hypothetical protein